MRSTTITLVLGTAVLLAQGSTGAQGTRRAVDPCTFFSKAEIESAFGHPYGPPKKGSTFLYDHCMFYSQNTGTISIAAGRAVTRPQFDSLRTALGEHAEPVSGVGQTAFLYNGKLYVLNNGRQLIVSLSGEMTPRWRAALITLGKLGASRLGA